MSTANFHTMDNFPLYAISDEAFYYQPLNEFDEPEGEEVFDEYEAQLFYNNVEKELDNINSDLLFHKITLKSGYYAGTQIYIENTHDTLEDLIKHWDNRDCRYEFDLYKSQVIRKFQAEINKINNKILPKIAKKHGFEQYTVYARFSNGETWYTKVS